MTEPLRTPALPSQPLPPSIPQATFTIENPAQKKRPQPIDYGLTYDDLNLYNYWDDRKSRGPRDDDGQVIRCVVGTRHDDEYKKGSRWFGDLLRHKKRYDTVSNWSVPILLLGILTFPFGGFILVGVGVAGMAPLVLIEELQRRASPSLRSYWHALHKYNAKIAAAEAAARQAARKAAHEAELRKRSYWIVLDGYSFENATAEVLNKHQFNARVTRGSGDGGIDIEVTRNGLRGVVQCKAHVACVGPSVVRDLYGVIHHSNADFGIVVSRGGFTRGAADFARDKPIYFLDTDHLIAMQEGKDVLAEAFAAASPDTNT